MKQEDKKYVEFDNIDWDRFHNDPGFISVYKGLWLFATSHVFYFNNELKDSEDYYDCVNGIINTYYNTNDLTLYCGKKLFENLSYCKQVKVTDDRNILQIWTNDILITIKLIPQVKDWELICLSRDNSLSVYEYNTKLIKEDYPDRLYYFIDQKKAFTINFENTIRDNTNPLITKIVEHFEKETIR